MASAGMSSAQTTAKSPNEFSVNIGYNIGLKKEVPDMLLLQTEYGRHINEQFYIGAGTGIIADTKFKTAGIPLFARAEVDFPTESLTPYISFQAGYDFNVSGGNGTGNGRINPVVGVKVPVSKNNTVNLGFGYTRTLASGGGSDYLGLRVVKGYLALELVTRDSAVHRRPFDGEIRLSAAQADAYRGAFHVHVALNNLR